LEFVTRGRDRFQLASLGERLVGQFLDGLIYLAIIVLGSMLDMIANTYFGFFVGLGFAILYLLFQDGLGEGQSLGKRVVKTRVIDEGTFHSGSFGQSFGRNLVLCVLGWIDWLFIFGERRQRLGDRLVHTLVVKDQKLPEAKGESDETWRCPKCDAENSKWVFSCRSCGNKVG